MRSRYICRASGTVVRAVNKTTEACVAIKMMELESQPKKELIVTEIEVHFDKEPNTTLVTHLPVTLGNRVYMGIMLCAPLG